MERMKKYLLFVLMVAAVVLIIKLLNWVPLSVERGSIRKYGTVEEVRRDLKIRKVLLPSYFPEHLSWPPSEIFAQRRPFPLVIMNFTGDDSGRIVLAISQAETEGKPMPAPALRIEPYRIRKERTLTIKGRKARLVLGSCRGGGECNSLAWQEGDYSMKVVERGPEEELLKISESMLSD